MNTDELNNWLATEVMGWFGGANGFGTSVWMENEDKFIFQHKWKPDTDLNQARQCLDVMKGNISINRGYNGWCVEIKNYNKETDCLDTGKSVNRSMSLAICEAIKKALESK